MKCAADPPPLSRGAAPRVGVAIGLLCVAFFLLPQPKPRYKPGEEPSAGEKTEE